MWELNPVPLSDKKFDKLRKERNFSKDFQHKAQKFYDVKL